MVMAQPHGRPSIYVGDDEEMTVWIIAGHHDAIKSRYKENSPYPIARRLWGIRRSLANRIRDDWWMVRRGDGFGWNWCGDIYGT